MRTPQEELAPGLGAPSLALVHLLVHDLRSPLMSITHVLQLMFHDLAGRLSREQLDDLLEAMNAGWMLEGMVTSMLGLAQLEADALPFAPEVWDVSDLVRAATGSVRGLSRGRRIVVSTPGGPAAAWCDRGLTLRALMNLLANALEHTPSEGTVHVEVEVTLNGVAVRVRDPGLGVPRALRGELFERSAALDGGARDHHGRAGLGLAFAQLAVERQGGRIGAEREPGRGTLLWIELPSP